MSDATAADYGGFSNYGDGALWVDSYDASRLGASSRTSKSSQAETPRGLQLSALSYRVSRLVPATSGISAPRPRHLPAAGPSTSIDSLTSITFVASHARRVRRVEPPCRSSRKTRQLRAAPTGHRWAGRELHAGSTRGWRLPVASRIGKPVRPRVREGEMCGRGHPQGGRRSTRRPPGARYRAFAGSLPREGGGL